MLDVVLIMKEVQNRYCILNWTDKTSVADNVMCNHLNEYTNDSVCEDVACSVFSQTQCVQTPWS